MSKEAVSSSYIDALRERHAGKRVRQDRRRALITGIGRKGSIAGAIADRLASEGIHVIQFTGDVCVPSTWSLTPFSNEDILIMCHGMCSLNWIEEEVRASEIVAVNLTGSIALVQRFVRQTMDAPHRKKIISIGSMAHNRILNGSAAYCASKAGLAHYMRCAAWELAPKGFDVYSVHPSNTLDAPMSNDTIEGLMEYRGLSRAEAEAYWATGLIREKHLTKSEIASTVVKLLGDDAGYMSGNDINLGGGAR